MTTHQPPPIGANAAKICDTAGRLAATPPLCFAQGDQECMAYGACKEAGSCVRANATGDAPTIAPGVWKDEWAHHTHALDVLPPVLPADGHRPQRADGTDLSVFERHEMNTTDEIMALAREYASSSANAVLEKLYGTSPAYAAKFAGKAKEDFQSLQTAIGALVEQAKWAHHTPKPLSDADAAADLAGVARPGAEPVAWGWRRADGLILEVICPDEHEAHEGYYTVPLYTAPPQASQPLTAQEVEAIIARHDYQIHGDRARYIVRMTEQAHGIGAAQKGKP